MQGEEIRRMRMRRRRRHRALCVRGRKDEDRVFIFAFHWWGVVQVVEAGVFLVGLESCPICRSPSRAPLSPPLVLSPARPPRPNERRARLTGQPTEAAGRRERREEERGRGDEAQERSASCVGEKSQFKPVRASAHWLQEASAQRLSPALPGPRRLWVFAKNL